MRVKTLLLTILMLLFSTSNVVHASEANQLQSIFEEHESNTVVFEELLHPGDNVSLTLKTIIPEDNKNYSSDSILQYTVEVVTEISGEFSVLVDGDEVEQQFITESNTEKIVGEFPINEQRSFLLNLDLSLSKSIKNIDQGEPILIIVTTKITGDRPAEELPEPTPEPKPDIPEEPTPEPDKPGKVQTDDGSIMNKPFVGPVVILIAGIGIGLIYLKSRRDDKNEE